MIGEELPQIEIGDRVQYCSGNPSIVHPIGIVVKVSKPIKNKHQKIFIQFGSEPPRSVYANDYRICEKVKKE